MNWPNLIAELQAANVTQAEIAKACGCSQPSISELARGSIKEPRHSLGEALVALHTRHCKAAA